jgi:predicted polyphosphate/ATP-dependent NAD kinase
MRSGVFGTTPEAAGDAARRYLADPGRYALLDAEIVDTSEAGDVFGSVLQGSARVPAMGGSLQASKSAAPRSDEAALEALCGNLAEAMEPGRLYLLGPGTTTARISGRLGLGSTLLGVDAVRDGRLVGADLDERGILALLDETGEATLVLGVIGSQGFLLGRGNQQISAEVVARVGAANLVVIAGADKILALEPPCLQVDLGDPGEPPVLDGYVRVHTAPGRSIMLRVAR